MNFSTMVESDASQSTGIVQRVHATGAWIDPGTQVIIATNSLGHAGFIKHLHGHTASLPLLGPALDIAHCRSGYRGLYPTFTGGIALNTVAIDQFEHLVSRVAYHIDQGLGALTTKHL
ncbi:hypothetical protein D9M71_529120 [compost metagenome]